ncbi:MAG: SIS domain-containing protein [Chloroflexi bacterium]|nr:SIS domain-containing protein [Chloroflexota bacterium]MDL1883068.1 SIS domain-containing protein [Anaerolineae bacterium CFX8]
MEIRHYFRMVQDLLNDIPFDAVDRVVEVLEQARQAGQTVFICGNGGSAATASHFGNDLAKRTTVPGQPRFRVISLTDNNAIMTALSNDIGYDVVFSEQLIPLVRSGDVVIGISGSGSSPNVLNAMRVASEAGATTIGFCGFDGGQLKVMVDIPVHVPSNVMPMVEDVHLMLEHAICERLLAINQEASRKVALA